MSFNDLGLVEPIVRAVTAEGYTTPTPIQAKAIPAAIAGADILGCAQTGTGKTCAFALPILQRLDQSRGKAPEQSRQNPAQDQRSGGRGRRGGGRRAPQGRAPRALVLCPTRELASQIFDSFVTYGRNLKLRHAVVFGGVSQFHQERAMRSGVDVLIATPGRLLDLLEQGLIDLSAIETLVLDEADRMLDMGFINDIRRVIERIPERRQTLFFSATVSRDIRRLADDILRNPVTIETAPESTTIETVAQRVYHVERANKNALLERLLRGENVGRALVFTRTKHGADRLSKALRRSDINADAIHGNKTQNARTRAMNAFRSGSTTVLIATDIASRGIDVDEITHVVNYDMPVDAETYVHRIGRTARAGASGVAVTFCSRDEMGALRAIERRTKSDIEVLTDSPDLAPRTGGNGRDGRRNNTPSGDRRSAGGGFKPRSKGARPNDRTNEGGRGESRGPRRGGPGAGGRPGKPKTGGRRGPAGKSAGRKQGRGSTHVA